MSTGETVSDEELAYHEAGHAVMAVLKNVAIHKVSIVPDSDGTMGRVSHPTPRLSRQAFLIRSDGSIVDNPRVLGPPRKTKKRIEAELLLSLAGCAASALLHSPPPFRSRDELYNVVDSAVELLEQQGTTRPMSDAAMALELAEKLRGPTAIEKFIPIMMGEAVLILEIRSNWRAVQSLARELIESRQLSSRRVKEIVKQALADNC
jgi:hypothetical protein